LLFAGSVLASQNYMMDEEFTESESEPSCLEDLEDEGSLRGARGGAIGGARGGGIGGARGGVRGGTIGGARGVSVGRTTGVVGRSNLGVTGNLGVNQNVVGG
jgi:hypothetical protein